MHAAHPGPGRLDGRDWPAAPRGAAQNTVLLDLAWTPATHTCTGSSQQARPLGLLCLHLMCYLLQSLNRQTDKAKDSVPAPVAAAGGGDGGGDQCVGHGLWGYLAGPEFQPCTVVAASGGCSRSACTSGMNTDFRGADAPGPRV